MYVLCIIAILQPNRSYSRTCLTVSLARSHKVDLLAVVHALVLQPLAVSGDAVDFLAVVVRHGVREGVRGRVDAEALDSAVEVFVFLHRREG